MKTMLAVLGLVAAAAATAAGGPDGVFGTNPDSNEVVDIAWDQYRKHIVDLDRKYNVVALFTASESYGKECRMCGYYQKQFDDLVDSYKKQYRDGRVYFADRDAPVYFVRVLIDRSTEGIHKELKLRTMPTMALLPPPTEDAKGRSVVKAVEYGRVGLDDAEFKTLRKQADHAAAEKKKASKHNTALAKALKRSNRRKKQLVTQEEEEYESYGVEDSQTFRMNNICKFLRTRAGMQMDVCPQDVPLDFEQKKKPQDVLKNVLMLIILGSAAVCLDRVFGVYLELCDPNRRDLEDKYHMMRILAEDPRNPHRMVERRDPREVILYRFGFCAWVAIFSLLVGGVYWNLLHGLPWSGIYGRDGKNQQAETAMLGVLYTTQCAMMLMAVYSVSAKFLDFTREKGRPYSLSDGQREEVRFFFAIGGLVMWFVLFLMILRFFGAKNHGYLSGRFLSLIIR